MIFSAKMLDCYLINMYIEFNIFIMNSVLDIIVGIWGDSIIEQYSSVKIRLMF